MLKKTTLKKTEKICYKRLSLHKHGFSFLEIFVGARVNQISCFSFFLHLIYLPEHIFDKKIMGVIFKQKARK